MTTYQYWQLSHICRMNVLFSGTSTNCALDWSYQSGVCKPEAQSLPAANFHYLLLGVAIILVSVLTVPIYWGTNVTKVDFFLLIILHQFYNLQ